jgi:hypothetical protein
MTHRKTILAVLALVLGLGDQTFAIERVASRLGYLEVRSSYAIPQGTYEGLPGLDFDFGDGQTFAFDADRVFDDGFALGLTYGQLMGRYWRTSFGFDYAKNKVKNPILQNEGIYEYRVGFTDDETYHLYDLTIRGAFAPTNLEQSPWCPFVGLGVAFGFGSANAPGYETNYDFGTALSLDFGADVKLWTAPDSRSFVALSSINSWDIMATGNRIKLLQIGGGLRYFFKQ